VDSRLSVEPSLNLVELIAVATSGRVYRLHVASDRVFKHREYQPGFAVEHRSPTGQIEKLDRNEEIRLETGAEPRIGPGYLLDHPTLT